MSAPILTVVGTIAGAMFGQPQLGMALGAMAGSWLYPPESNAGPASLAQVGLTTAQKGQVLPVLWGKIRIAGSVIWYGDFDSDTTDVGGGSGGGGSKGQEQTTYSVGLAIAMCEGYITDLTKIWAGDEELVLADVDYTVYAGYANHGPDPYISTQLGTGQIATVVYPHTAFIVFNSFPLGSGTMVPNFTFELVRNTADTAVQNPVLTTLGLDAYTENADGDMNPVVCLADYLTYDRYGLGFDISLIHAESWLEQALWCQNENYYCSPVLDSAQPSSSHVEHLLSYFDGILIFSQGQFKLRSRRNPAYLAEDYAPVDWRDWLEQPRFATVDNRQTPNDIVVEYRSRENDYNVSVAERRDDWNVDARGAYVEQISMPGITTSEGADRIASKLLWSRIIPPFTVEMRLGPQAVYYECGDLISVIGSEMYALGNIPLRIIEIEEEKIGVFRVVAIEER